MYSYTPKGVCPRTIQVSLEGDTIKEVSFKGGCPGNLSAISKMVQGRPVDEIIEMFEGHTCGPKPTSCVDQLTCALKEARNK
jgi:uncharacterized protein (TIGR03905 family)